MPPIAASSAGDERVARGRRVVRGGEGPAGPQERRAVQRPGRAADRADQGPPAVRRQRRRRRPSVIVGLRARRRRASRRSPRTRGPCWCRGRRRRSPGRARSARRLVVEPVGGEPQPGLDDVEHREIPRTRGGRPSLDGLVRRPPPRREARRRSHWDRRVAQTPQRRAGGMDRGVPQLGQLIVEPQERDREAGHLQARDVVADERAADR